jgi:hypothetical protein
MGKKRKMSSKAFKVKGRGGKRRKKSKKTRGVKHSKKKAAGKRRRKGSKSSGRKNVKKLVPLLQVLGGLTSTQLGSVLEHLKADAREALYDCFYNCLYNKKIPKAARAELKTKLAARKRVISYLANPKNDPLKKRKLLKQTGGFLPAILAAVLPLITSLIASK